MIAITGATGNIGSKITADLLSKGQNVRCIARTADNLKSFADKGADIATISLEDTAALSDAFRDIDAIFAMIPPDYQASDFRAFQNTIGASIAKAVETSGVKYVVNLSSQGAHLPDKTGPIKGLHDQEQRLNKLKGVNILHLRPTYFMENLLANIDMIKQMNIMGSAIRGDMKIPMIATQDIARFAAERLLKKDFSGMTVKDLLGQRDVSMNEAAKIIGKKIDKPDLKYVQFSYEDTEKALVDMGFSADVAGLFIEMSKAFNQELINAPRTQENTTDTPLEEFAEVFARIFFA
ncbi:MAG: NmrA family NAD(P)-binding protein [Candidatus Deferrimicrobiaceae bacterium]|jgi:uncharacterized protein YbjT (DUF2867 family)